MAVISITYDLRNPKRDYTLLYETIEDCSTGNWCKFCESSYLIQTKKSVSQIYGLLNRVIDENDRILVIEVNNNYMGRLDEDDSELIGKMFHSIIY